MILPKLPVNYTVLGGWYNYEMAFPFLHLGEIVTHELVDKEGIFKEPVEFKTHELLERE